MTKNTKNFPEVNPKQSFSKWEEEMFDLWNNEKKKIHTKSESKIPYFREWQVWFISMWINIWFEQDGKNEDFSRPILILKKFNKDMFLWIPSTTKVKHWFFYYDIWNIKWQNNFLILSQIKLYSSKRLLSHIWWIEECKLKEIKQKINALIE